MGLEFAHPEGAKFVMRRLYAHGVWAIFSTLDPRVLQYKPGLLLDPATCAEILEKTEAAIGEARDDAPHAAPQAAAHVFAERTRRHATPRPAVFPAPSPRAAAGSAGLTASRLAPAWAVERRAGRTPASVATRGDDDGHDLSAGGDVLDRVTAFARSRARRLRRPPGRRCHGLLNVSENATFLVTDPDAGPSVLRVHRLGYHSRAGDRVGAGVDGRAAGRGRHAHPAGAARRRRPPVVAVTERGVAADGTACGSSSCRGPSRPDRTAGRGRRRTSRSSARSPPGCTRTPGTGTRPGWFTRFRWDVDAAFGAASRAWGRWQDGVGVGPAEAEILGRLERQAPRAARRVRHRP